MKKWQKIVAAGVGLVLLTLIVVLVLQRKAVPEEVPVEEAPIELLYGIEKGSYTITEDRVGSGETLGQILGKYGIGAPVVDQVSKASEGVFSLKNIRAEHHYTTFQTPDSLAKLVYFVYEASLVEYLVIDFSSDTVKMRLEHKDVTVERVMRKATIQSSLWNSMLDNDMSPALAMELSEIYAWSIDFFALQEGDEVTVIYEQKYVDTTSVGVGMIWGARFDHGGQTYYAIPFKQNDKIGYWDEKGNSLRKSVLKAPLKFSRISSKFSNSRLHPVLRIRRPHHGVDYAAPSGTPVVAVSDGVVIFKGYAGGGGNTLKIKHNTGDMVSGYLHLKGYAKGINNGTRVRQGQLIGYVGSTGLSTGAHLDFRIWKKGKPIDPLKVPTEPGEPVSAANKAAYMAIKDRVLAELKGELPDSLKVTSIE